MTGGIKIIGSPKKAACLALLTAAATCFAVMGYLGALQLTANFHTVIPGVLYRSAQPSVHEIDDYRTLFGIKTIIKLRGADQAAGWYRAEIDEAQRLNIEHVDFRMFARDLVSQSQVEAARRDPWTC